MKRLLILLALLLLLPEASAKGPAESTWLRPGEPMVLLLEVTGNASFSFRADEPLRVRVDAANESVFDLTQPFGELRLPRGAVDLRVTHENATEVAFAWALEGYAVVRRSDGVHHLPASAFETPSVGIAAFVVLVVIFARSRR